MSLYQEPPWAVPPRPGDEWSLTEIKEGVTVAVHALSMRCTVLGRAADQVHIVLSHESCSRQHARVAFDSSGRPWLRDLHSTHGTTVNKKRLPQMANGREESNSTKTGSRGVVLYPGDVIQLGASTRLFCLEGPEAYTREAFRKIVPSIAKPQDQSDVTESTAQDGMHNIEASQPLVADNDAAWDDNDESDANGDQSVQLPHDMEDRIPDQHRKAWDKLKASKQRLANVQGESERIRRKGVDLSEGQTRQLERNAEIESKLQEEIKRKELELYRLVYPEKNNESVGHKDHADTLGADDDELDESDFYDRTKQDDAALAGDEDNTEASLTEKWKDLRRERLALLAELDDAQEDVILLEERLSRLRSSGDEESFFVKNDLDLATDTCRRLEEKKRQVENFITETEHLLKICNPRLRIDLVSGYVGTEPVAVDKGSAAAAAAATIVAAPLIQQRDHQVLETASPQDRTSMPPPVARPSHTYLPLSDPADDTNEAEEEEDAETHAGIMPPPKRSRVHAPEPPVGGNIMEKKTNKVENQRLGTLASLAAAYPRDMRDNSRQDRKTVAATTNGDEKNDLWQAPKDQDGSGFTRLNEKFAGRY